MMEENLLKILAKKGRRFTIAYKGPLSDKFCGREYFFINMWIIYCETVGKHDFSGDFFYYRVNMKDKKCCSDQMNRSL